MSVRTAHFELALLHEQAETGDAADQEQLRATLRPALFARVAFPAGQGGR